MPISSIRLPDGGVRISARGDVDLDNAYQLRDAVDEALAGAKPAGIVIDLTFVPMIDSVGIGTLVACFHAAAASGVRLRLSNPATIVYRQLWVAGLVGLFSLPTPALAGARATSLEQ